MSDIWQTIVRWVAGEPARTSSGGLETSVQASGNAPFGLGLLAVAGLALFFVLVYRQERSLAGWRWKTLLTLLRTASAAIVVLMLYGWTIQRHHTELADVVLLIDDSASMGIVDVTDSPGAVALVERRLQAAGFDEATRLNLAKALLLERDGALLDALSRRYNLRVFLIGGEVRPLPEGDARPPSLREAGATHPSSRLGSALRQVLEQQRGRPTAAAILLTDGVTTEGKSLTETAQFARRKAIPLFFVGLGSDREPLDLRLAELLADEAAFTGDVLHFDLKLYAEGYRGKTTVRLKRAGSDEVLDERNIDVTPDASSQSVQLAHRAEEPGEYEFVVEVDSVRGETNTENNRLTRKVSVREETIRVLLVQAYPSYEFRMLKQALLRELNAGQTPEGAGEGLRTVLQEADLEYAQTDVTAERVFPVSREELFKYDVLVFGDVNPSLLSPSILQNIYEFVTVRGGGLIFAAGPRYTPLAYRDTAIEPLFPVSLDTVSLPDPDAAIVENFRPVLTPLGRASASLQLADAAAANDALWREKLEPLRWFARCPDVRPGVRVLAEHPTARSSSGQALPIITLQFIGAGKVIFHATDETHRWRMRVGDRYFSRYWIQSIRYLCRSRLLSGNRLAELTTDREQYQSGDSIELRVRFFDDRLAPAEDDGVVVMVQHVGGQRRRVTLSRSASERGIFEASAGTLGEGQYRAWVAAPALDGQPPTRQFAVVAPPGELARTQMDAAEMRAAAQTSGGKFYTFATAPRLLGDLPRGRQVRIESLPPEPIWNTPFLAGLFVTLIATEWLLRKRLGLL